VELPLKAIRGHSYGIIRSRDPTERSALQSSSCRRWGVATCSSSCMPSSSII
jgi:hypothetical protein